MEPKFGLNAFTIGDLGETRSDLEWIRPEFPRDRTFLVQYATYIAIRMHTLNTLRNRRTSGFTLVELLVVIAVVGILIAITLPAIQQVRAAARRTHCKNNLKQIAISCLHFHDANEAFPPARLTPRTANRDFTDPYAGGYDEPSWFVRVLPYLEQNQLYLQWDVWDSYEAASIDIRTAYISTFYCPARRSGLDDAVIKAQKIVNRLPCGCGGSSQVISDGVGGDYAGNHGNLDAVGDGGDFYRGGNGSGLIISSRCKSDPNALETTPLGDLRLRPFAWIDKIRLELVRDGASNTFLVGEAHIPLGQIQTPPFDGPIFSGVELSSICRVGGPGVPIARQVDAIDPSITYQWGSWHPGQCHFSMGDASVHSISNSIDTITLGHLCHRSDGEHAQLEDY